MTPSFPQLGITFSHTHARWLDLDPTQALAECLAWPLHTIRLCLYWSECESEPGIFVFDAVEKLVQQCQAAGRAVVLTVGVKAPRWPEFYFPQHVDANLNSAPTRDQLITFVEESVRHFRSYDCISHWQVENEPLDPSGPNNAVIPIELLSVESERIRAIDSRPQIITLWGNELSTRNHAVPLTPLADTIGIDLYYRAHFTWRGLSAYSEPHDDDTQIAALLKKLGKPAWIMELQAEPWEKNEAAYRAPDPSSLNLTLLQSNFMRAASLPVDHILFWGAEYWLWRKKQGDSQFVDWVQTLTTPSAA